VDTHTEVDPSEDQVQAAVATLKLLADPTRLRVLWALFHGEHSVGPLAEHVGVPAAGLSQHLAKLRLAQLVTTRKDGNRVFYVAEGDHVRRLVEEALFHADHVVGVA
jgi:DNA-binding transcriptional ArsR family regulator